MDDHERVVDPLGDPKDGHILTRAIIDTIREPLIVLDEELRIIAASRSFYSKFHLTSENTTNKLFYELGKGQWNIPQLRTLLEQVIPKNRTVESYEVTHTFPHLGLRTMLVTAREILYENGKKKMLLSILDVTDQHALEAEKEQLIVQKDILLKEMRHRIANSLQLIASILLLKAETVRSKKGRLHFEDAHERIMSIATVQEQLDPVGIDEKIEVKKYLTRLCNSLARSMIGADTPIILEVTAGEGSVSSDKAVSFGLVATELIINSIKHAFPGGKSGKIMVTYSTVGSSWILSVEDNGIGLVEKTREESGGLGTSIVDALANQLDAVIETQSSSLGTKVSIIKKPDSVGMITN